MIIAGRWGVIVQPSLDQRVSDTDALTHGALQRQPAHKEFPQGDP